MSLPLSPEDLALLAELAAYNRAFAGAAAAALLLADTCDVYATARTRQPGGAVKEAKAENPRLAAIPCAIAPRHTGAGGQETAGAWNPRGAANPLDTTVTEWVLKVPVGTGLVSGDFVTLASTGATFKVKTVDDQGTWRVFDEAIVERLGARDA